MIPVAPTTAQCLPAKRRDILAREGWDEMYVGAGLRVMDGGVWWSAVVVGGPAEVGAGVVAAGDYYRPLLAESTSAFSDFCP